jgi:hypothetical protein
MPVGRLGRAKPEAPKPRVVRGWFDGVVDGEAVGWCWQPEEPSLRLEVDIIVDGERIAGGTANRLRDNLARAGIGDGRYSFRVALPARFADGGPHRIAVRTDGFQLPAVEGFLGGARRKADGLEAERWVGTAFVPDLDPAVAADADSDASEDGDDGQRDAGTVPAWRRLLKATGEGREPQEVRGYVEGVRGTELFGWAVDPTQPRRSLELEAFFDGVRLGPVIANRPREDVERAGYGLRHGFFFTLPEPPEAGRHTVEVRTVEGAFRVALNEQHVVLDQAGVAVEDLELLAVASTAPLPQPASMEALLGRDGWLFEWPADDRFHVLRGAVTPAPGAVQTQCDRLGFRRQQAAATGAVLVEAVIPAKLAVYPEYLPAGLEVDQELRPADLVVAAVREENELELLDLTGALRHAKGHGEVYLRTGRGLTWSGAFAGYRAIAKELAKSAAGIVPMRREQLRLGDLELAADSLIELPRLVWTGSSTFPAAAAGADEEHEGEPRLDWKAMSTEYVVLPPELGEIAGPDATMLQRREPGRRGDAVIIHDGSGARVAPFIAEHFGRTLTVGAGAQVDRLMVELQPVAVVEIVAEVSLLL